MKTFAHTAIALVAAFAGFAALSQGAQAAEPADNAAGASRAACIHPALARGAACSTVAGIDANTFIVQPPAATRWIERAGPANADHPAVAIARSQRVATLDANTFIVQPPVAVSWTVREPQERLAATTAVMAQ